MDISDSEHSEELEDLNESDSDWVQSTRKEDMNEESDSDWEQSARKIRRRRRTVSSHSNSNLGRQIIKENVEPEKFPDAKSTFSKDDSWHGCSCSKSSSCKTNKCECRGSGAQCGEDCGCKSSKCSNRESSDNTEIVNQGVMLLENAFSKKEVHDVKSRQPLADIGNTHAKQNAEVKTKPRKNWRRATVQLVPSDPLPPSAPANTEAAPRDRGEIPLRLPRAMSSAAAESNPPPLTDRNAAKPEECVSSINKESTGAAAVRPPSHLRKNSTTEKENQLR